jgi:hypothetical protein
MKRYYKIGEVADMLNMAPSAIRFWCKYFAKHLIFHHSQLSATRKRKDRKFLFKEVEKLFLIWYLVKVEKYTLEGVKRQIVINGPKWKKITQNSINYKLKFKSNES